MAPPKLNLKERLSDEGEIDLSMSDLHDVPVKEIGALKKAHVLDLSNNHLKTLPVNFAGLSHITKLDLSKNELVLLPDNFGDLVKLKYLDLYRNKLEHLPVSFHKLKSLKWLDLKDNPLTPALVKVAGPCTKASECESCAKHVVAFFTQVQEQVTIDLETRLKHRQKQLELNQQKEMENKKNKKKEKSKAKKENGPTKEPQKNSKQQQKKKGDVGKGTRKTSSMCSCLAGFFLFILATLFILTSIKCEYTKFIENTTVELFNSGAQMLPPAFNVYVSTGGEYVRWVHDKTGVYTIQVVKYASNRDNYVDAYNKICVFTTAVIDKVKEQYKKYVS